MTVQNSGPTLSTTCVSNHFWISSFNAIQLCPSQRYKIFNSPALAVDTYGL